MIVAVCAAGVVDTPGRLAATAPGESTLKQASMTVRPVSTPAPNRMPEAKRVFKVTLKKSLTCVCFPPTSGTCFTTLLTTPNFASETSYMPQT